MLPKRGHCFGAKITYLFIGSSPVLLLFFFLDYYGYKRFLSVSRRVFLLWLIPAIALVLVFTNDIHHLFWSSYFFSADREIPGASS